MSTTLTNGLKLPDKGSVDWYADMQNNYAILDGAVGTIAEHTSALAGKAPLVHTHTKADITDFPAYGTTAGTICEGNDSRLSDARTPVAHTHGNVTNDGKLATASKVVISDSNKNITTSSVSDTELGYLSGVTSSVQTQLNGKAASNHVHGNISNDGKVGTTANKPLITGGGGRVMTGAFGNAANTFCEGNDSRLSDARTPVAHTHTKSDVTDLLNSNFIPSANNSYDLGSSSYQWNNLYAKNYFYNGTAWGLNKANTWSGDNTFTKYLNSVIDGTEIGVAPNYNNRNGILFKDKNGVNIGWLRYQYDTSGDISIEMLVSNKYKNGALDPTGTQVYKGAKQVITASGDSYFNWSGTLSNSVVPRINNSYDLGSSSYQWNNLYAKNYFCNGVAWGLDKANVWTENNSYRKDVILSNSSIQVGVTPTSSRSSYLYFNDNYGSTIGYLRDRVYTSGETQMHLSVHNKYSNGALDINGSDVQGDLYLGIKSNGTTFISVNSNSVIPTTTSVTDLGSTDNKWKTLNGVNPGALSLPNLSRKSSILEYITDLTGGLQYYTPLADGWICIQTDNSSATNYIRCAYDDILVKANGNGQAQGLSVLIPVLAGVQIGIRVVCTTLSSAYFYHCQGNVT